MKIKKQNTIYIMMNNDNETYYIANGNDGVGTSIKRKIKWN